MGEIRILDASHVEELALLQLKIMRHQRAARPPAALVRYVGDIFLRNPWYTDEIPSLVYVHNGKIAGFLGVMPRPMLFGGVPIRAAVASQFMIDRDQYRGMAGMEMLKQFFAGPQDLSFTDGGTEAAYTTWTAAGARAAWLYSIEWTRVLRPARYARGLLEERKGKWRMLGKAMALPAAGADAVLSMVPLRALAAPVKLHSSAAVGPDELLTVIKEIGWREPLKPHYEAEAFRWLIAQTTEARAHGALRLKVIRDAKSQAIGWYVFFAKPGGVATVMQLGSKSRSFDQVLQNLLHDAWEEGAAAVRGQSIPRYLTNFTAQHCGLRHLGSGVLVHSRNKELEAAILRGDAALSRLDGEWWMRFAFQDWGPEPA